MDFVDGSTPLVLPSLNDFIEGVISSASFLLAKMVSLFKKYPKNVIRLTASEYILFLIKRDDVSLPV